MEEFVAHIVQMKGSTSRADVQSLLLETAVLQMLGLLAHSFLSVLLVSA